MASNTPWLRANSDTSLILTGASVSPCWSGVPQSVVITNNPSTIDQNQQLLVRFPNLSAHDVIVPGIARLAFRITLNSEDANGTIVQNLGRASVKKTVIKISGNEVMSVDDSDVFNCYGDLWKTALERKNDQYQGIDTSGNRNAMADLHRCRKQSWDSRGRLGHRRCLRQPLLHPARFRAARGPHAALPKRAWRPAGVRTHLQWLQLRNSGHRRCRCLIRHWKPQSREWDRQSQSGLTWSPISTTAVSRSSMTGFWGTKK